MTEGTRAGNGRACNAPAGDGGLGDDEAHLAALLAVLALTRADTAPQDTPLQQWRARRLAALSADQSTVDAVDGARRLPRRAGKRTSF